MTVYAELKYDSLLNVSQSQVMVIYLPFFDMAHSCFQTLPTL